MSDRDDDHLYRGDPPAGSTAAGQWAGQGADQGTDQGRPPSGYPPPDRSAAAGYAPPSGYGAPSYGAPSGWQPPAGYGPPPGYAPAGPYGAPGWGPGWRQPTNTMAILALVLAFVFPPAGLVLGIVARRQIRETREEGDGLALAGIIIGGIATALFVLLIVFWVIAFVSITSSDGFAP